MYAGALSRCPGYVDIALDDWSTSEELFHYDLAVLCPPHFNAAFYLPHRALVGTTNRTFLVTLNDTRQRYQVFLTAIQHPTHREHSQRQMSEVASFIVNSDHKPLKVESQTLLQVI